MRALLVRTDQGKELYDCPLGNPTVGAGGERTITLLNAVANAWKHEAEWPIQYERQGEETLRKWTPRIRAHAETSRLAEQVGMRANETGNLMAAAEHFGVLSPYTDLALLRQKATTWAESILDQAKNEAGI
jgi:hypothetical protein